MIAIKPQFKIRINYKSGNFVEGWMWKFSTKAELSGRTYKWISSPKFCPINGNVDDIESVWQTGFRRWRLYIGSSKLFD